jgi:hypothetical protein
MSSYDPRVIAVALEDLLLEMRLWSARASQTLAAASYVQRQAHENAERAFYRASVLLDEAQRDDERAGKINSEANAIMDKCRAGREEATDTIAQAQDELDAATLTLEFWENELGKALAWLERAEARLARAIAEYNLAQTAYGQAQWEVKQAESRYRSCVNDKDRNNCDREARDLNSAQEDLMLAAHRVQMARQEVNEAEAEVAAAKAQVRCCSNAVRYATQAVTLATEAESQAQQALNSAERSLEFAEAAVQNALIAHDKVVEEMQAAEQMLAVTRNVVSTTDDAATQLAAADGAEDYAQRYARSGWHELEHRLQLLYQLNKPELNITAIVGAISVNTGQGAGQTTAWVDEGIQFVNVTDLPDPEGISGSADFKKIPESEMRAGIEKLHEMRTVIENGEGASSDYWADYDKKRGLGFAEGYRRIYDAFYGTDCIKVNKDQDSYDIDNGRHRIWLAKLMGVKQLPVRIVARKRHE